MPNASPRTASAGKTALIVAENVDGAGSAFSERRSWMRVGNCFSCVICSNERAHKGGNHDETRVSLFGRRVVELAYRRACSCADNIAIQITRSRGGHCTKGVGPAAGTRR